MLNWIFYSTEIVKRKIKKLTFGIAVDDLEVEPLGVTLRVDVVLKPQVVLNVVHLDGSSQIGVFKSAIENKHVFLLRHIDSVCMSWLSGHEWIVIIWVVICWKVKVSLRDKFWKMFVKELIEFILKVSFTRLLVKKFLRIRYLCLIEEEIEVSLMVLGLFIIVNKVAVTHNSRKCIIDYYTTKLCPMKLIWVVLERRLCFFTFLWWFLVWREVLSQFMIAWIWKRRVCIIL